MEVWYAVLAVNSRTDCAGVDSYKRFWLCLMAGET